MRSLMPPKKELTVSYDAPKLAFDFIQKNSITVGLQQNVATING